MSSSSEAQMEFKLLSADLRIEDQHGNRFAVSMENFDPQAFCLFRQHFLQRDLALSPVMHTFSEVLTTLQIQGKLLKDEQTGILFTLTKEEFDEHS